jgi:hypothetical protein
MPIFDRDSLHTSVAKQLQEADLGDAKNAVAAVVTRDGDGAIGVYAVVSTKVNDLWIVQAAVGIDHEKRIEGGIEIKAAW